MADLTFEQGHAPAIGVPEPLGADLVAVTAPNAGPMTYTGTRTYLLGTRDIAVIDPGPDDRAHIDAIVAAVPAGARVSAILVTHAHRDHSAGARALQERLCAPILGHGVRGRSAVMEHLAAAGGIGGGEGVDVGFVPDRCLADGAEITGAGWRLTALHTPGHLGDHLCFADADGSRLFSGDLVMGWSTTLISPPDGDLGSFLRSLRRLRSRGENVFYPGHGSPLRAPAAMIDALLAHRAAREAQILAALHAGPLDVPELVATVYPDLGEPLRAAAGRNVLAHLVDLDERRLVASVGRLTATGTFRLSSPDSPAERAPR